MTIIHHILWVTDMSGFIGGVWYNDQTYNEMIEERNERLENERVKKDQVIEKIIELKKLKSGVTINSEIQVDRLKKRTLDNLKVILDKWEKIEV